MTHQDRERLDGWLLERGASRDSADAALMCVGDGISEGCASDQRTELELIAARHEDGACLSQRLNKI
jgi:hypothetical protein